MNVTVGDDVAVRRVWRLASGGVVSDGGAHFRLQVSDGAGGWLYLQDDDSLDVALATRPLSWNGVEWIGAYTVPESLASREVHEVASHSTHGTLSCTYAVEVLNVADVMSRPSAKHHP